jgi:Histone RNA hairpin-binding protein RNA-binding domain
MMTNSPYGGMVNHIPPSNDRTTKRCNSIGTGTGTGAGINSSINYNTGSSSGNENHATIDSANKHDSKRQKMDWDLEPFAKLNPDDNDVHAQRIASRYKMILKGKNTVGYDQYVQQVPKHLRRIRSMDTPNTPDHTLDIPAKRWQGLVKAWYVSSVVPRGTIFIQ